MTDREKERAALLKKARNRLAAARSRFATAVRTKAAAQDEIDVCRMEMAAWQREIDILSSPQEKAGG